MHGIITCPVLVGRQRNTWNRNAANRRFEVPARETARRGTQAHCLRFPRNTTCGFERGDSHLTAGDSLRSLRKRRTVATRAGDAQSLSGPVGRSCKGTLPVCGGTQPVPSIHVPEKRNRPVLADAWQVHRHNLPTGNAAARRLFQGGCTALGG